MCSILCYVGYFWESYVLCFLLCLILSPYLCLFDEVGLLLLVACTVFSARRAASSARCALSSARCVLSSDDMFYLQHAVPYFQNSVPYLQHAVFYLQTMCSIFSTMCSIFSTLCSIFSTPWRVFYLAENPKFLNLSKRGRVIFQFRVCDGVLRIITTYILNQI